jgi:hypothetical protein
MALGFQGQLFDSWAKIEWQLYSSASTCNGHDAEDREQLLTGVELDHPKADCREHRQSALWSPHLSHNGKNRR